MKFRRINFFAGPGAEKDTCASYVFSQLKIKGNNCEIIPEYVKKWTYFNRKPRPWHQLYIVAKQLHQEYEALECGFDFIISSSPLLMQTYYGKLLGYKCWKDNVEIVREFENEYPSVNIFLNRNGLTYQETGRFQSKEEAIKIDNELIKFISDSKVINNLVEYESVDLHGIMDYISTELTLRR